MKIPDPGAIDCDLHPAVSGMGVLLPYLDDYWREMVSVRALDRLNLSRNTLVILSSDNGPVVDDGYADGAVENLNGHRPAGPLRGGKYSIFEGGTRVPFIIRWPGHVPASHVNTASVIGGIDCTESAAAMTAKGEIFIAPRKPEGLAAAILRSRNVSGISVSEILPALTQPAASHTSPAQQSQTSAARHGRASANAARTAVVSAIRFKKPPPSFSISSLMSSCIFSVSISGSSGTWISCL